MNLNTDLIKNKQRILISGNRGSKEIFTIVKTILHFIKKPADFADLEAKDHTFSDAPVVILTGGEWLENGRAAFHQLDIHILLVHQITDSTPEGYANFNAYVDEYEQLADNLPKAGSLIFNELDDVVLIIGKKEREDVKIIEYTSLKPEATGKSDPEFLSHAAAAKALLNRIGVSDQQFFAGLKTL